MKNTTYTRSWAVLTAVVGILGACGDSSGDNGSATQTSGINTTTGGTTGGTDDGTTGGPTTSTSADTTAGTQTGTSGVDTGTSGSTTTASDTSATSGTDDTSGSGSTSAASADTGVVPCDIADANLQPIPPNVMLVLDKSGSMVSNTWDHDQDNNTAEITRWNSLYNVVDFITTTFDDQINFGANLFPSVSATATYDANACVVSNAPEIPVSPMNSANILAGIPGAMDTDLHGGTPATAGVTVARDHLVTLNPANPRAMIFITDGAANCTMGTNPPALFEQYDSNLPVVVGDAWQDDEIPTYVVGIDIENATSPMVQDGSPDNTNTYDELNTVAVEGGKPLAGNEQFYQTTNQNELQDAMQQIIDDALSCTVELNPVPAFPDLLEVYVGMMFIPHVTDCQTEDGWVYTNPNGPYDSIEMCGTACDTLKAEGSVHVEYYCNPG